MEQNGFLMDYELSDPIKKSKAIVLGASAGAINMCAKWLCSKNFGYDVENSSFYNGIALNDFSVLSHFDLENNMAMVQDELSLLSKEMKVYVSNKDCVLRIKGDKIDILGNVYLISNSDIQKMNETF